MAIFFSIPDNKLNIGYKVLVECGDEIVRDLAKDPKSFAVKLHTRRLISDRTLSETMELQEIMLDKGRRLYTSVLGEVKHHAERYDDFIFILRDEGTLCHDLVKGLQVTYCRLEMPKLE